MLESLYRLRPPPLLYGLHYQMPSNILDHNLKFIVKHLVFDRFSTTSLFFNTEPLFLSFSPGCHCRNCGWLCRFATCSRSIYLLADKTTSTKRAAGITWSSPRCQGRIC